MFIRQFSHSVEERFKHTVDRIPLEESNYTGIQPKLPSDGQMEMCNCNVMMIEIQDLEGVQNTVGARILNTRKPNPF